jgi:hypothetical protein
MPPIPALLGPAIQGGLGLVQGIMGGIGMARQAKREPKYEIPKEVGEAVGLARGMAAEGMPAAQRTQAMQDIQQSAMMGMSAAQSRRGGLMSAQNIQAGMDRSALNLAAQDAAMRQQNQRFMYSALMAGASYADKAFSNRWQSWANKMQQSRALFGAGLQNIGGVAQSLGTQALYETIYGDKKKEVQDKTTAPQELTSNMINTGGANLWG